MKILLTFFVLLFLGGCAIRPLPKPAPTKSIEILPVCKVGQTDNCRKLEASDLGGTVRGYE